MVLAPRPAPVLLSAAALALSGLLAPGTAAATTTTGRVAGADRYATAAAISRAAWTSANTSVVYLASGATPVDALTAGTLTGGPILLASANGLPAATDAELTRLGDKPVVVIGGTAVLPDAVARAASRGRAYSRLAGATRIDTSVAVSRKGFATSRTVYLASAYGPDGMGSPDAVAGGSLTDGPILLVDPREGPTAAVRAEIARLGATSIVQLGGTPLGIAPTSVLAGPDRYATSLSVAHHVVPYPQTVYLARGDVFTDAAAAGSLTDGQVVLTRSDSLPQSVCEAISSYRTKRVVALGGPGSVSDAVLAQAAQCGAPEWDPYPPTQADTAAEKLTRGFAPPLKQDSLATLNSLTVEAPGPMTGYSRTLFPHWKDASTWGWPVAPSNSCDARGAALYRDGVGVTVNSYCTVQTGRWLDPYTAAWYESKTDIDIDHLVPLAAAWRSGAASWTTEQRTAYANSPLVLVSVQDLANQAKGDKTPDLWKPANTASWCYYGQRYTAVKAAYHLSISASEKAALTSMIDSCRPWRQNLWN